MTKYFESRAVESVTKWVFRHRRAHKLQRKGVGRAQMQRALLNYESLAQKLLEHASCAHDSRDIEQLCVGGSAHEPRLVRHTCALYATWFYILFTTSSPGGESDFKTLIVRLVQSERVILSNDAFNSRLRNWRRIISCIYTIFIIKRWKIMIHIVIFAFLNTNLNFDYSA